MNRKIAFHTLLISMIALLWIQPALAENPFGVVTVSQGSLTIIRNSESIAVTPEKTETVQKLDLLLAGSESSISWQVDETTTLEMGSNAVMMLKPWRRAGNTGYLSLGYGAASLQSETETVIKTPASVIRYTGNIIIETTSTGNTLISVIAGQAKLNNFSAESTSLGEGQAALVINGKLIVPDPEQLAGLSVSGENLNRPPISSPMALFFKTEAALMGAGVLSPEMVEAGKITDINVEESFDRHVNDESEIKDPAPRPVSNQMASDLEALNEMEVIEVESETDEVGTIQIRESSPEDVFAEFESPKTPGDLMSLDDKSSWTRESGLILVTVEK